MQDDTPEQNKAYIYGLVDPRTDEIRYIGWAIDPKKRFDMHIATRNYGKTHKNNWINQLSRLGLVPRQVILQEIIRFEWAIAERAWIRYGWEKGWRLTNMTIGGDGTPGRECSIDTRQKISAAVRGFKHTEETRQKMSISHTGKPRPESFKEKVRLSNSKRTVSEKTKQKIRVAHLGRTASIEARRKISEAGRGRIHSEETKVKMSKSAQIRWAQQDITSLPVGERASNSKLTNQQVIEIRRLNDSGEMRGKKLAEKFGIGYQNLWQIVTRRSWKHLP